MKKRKSRSSPFFSFIRWIICFSPPGNPGQHVMPWMGSNAEAVETTTEVETSESTLEEEKLDLLSWKDI